MADDEQERTYGIWWILVAFVVIGIIGLAGVLVVGNTRSGTEQIPTRSTTSVPLQSTTAVPPAVTLPDGGQAPNGVTNVVSSGGSTAYSFAIPDGLAEVPVRAVVAAATAVPSADGRALQINVKCTAGTGEAVAQISISETPDTVTVLPVVLTPGTPGRCAPDTDLLEISLPLANQLGTRHVVLVPTGTGVPTPPAG